MFSFTFQTEYNYQMSTFGATSSYIPYNNSQSIEYRGVGYTTNYSNGQFNSTQYYQGTYTPVASSPSGGSRPGQPRRVVIHNPNNPNDSLDTHLQDDYDPIWSYYHGTYQGWILHPDDRWYEKRGDKLYYWNGSEWVEVGIFDNMWSHDKTTANPSVPIGDNYIWFMVCIVSIYSLIKWIKLKRFTN